MSAQRHDEQDRLTWSGSTGKPTSTGAAIASDTLTSAQYTQTFSYDGRFASDILRADILVFPEVMAYHRHALRLTREASL